jgi:aromatic ring-opening dioxygenase catalytic subunit (LigB family)
MMGLFVSHGSPTILIEEIPSKKVLKELGGKV